MKILIIHNEYGKRSGEEVVVDKILEILNFNGHVVRYYSRSSEELARMTFGKAKAFFSGIYSFTSRKKVRDILNEFSPDIVHIHNLYPLISPSILPECKKAGIPVVMTVHNYRLVCPIGLQMLKGSICERCNKSTELWCIINNCAENYLKSIGYALRNFNARKNRFYLDNVTRYLTLSDFQKKNMINNGFNEDIISVLPNMIDMPAEVPFTDPGEFVGYIGRISREKGINILAEAAANNPGIPFKLAGSNNTKLKASLPGLNNFKLIGFIDKGTLHKFYSESRFIVLPSICYETFGLVVVEAMFHEKAVICSRIGGLPEIVDDGRTGLLFEPGNSDDLSEKIKYLWDHPEICKKMGRAGRKKALQNYSPEKYYQSIISEYKKAIKKNNDNINIESILGYRISTLDKAECIRLIITWIKTNQKNKYFVCANPHSLIVAESDLIFKKTIQSADLITPDGVGIILASKLSGGQISKRITGSDIFYGLSEYLEEKEKSKYSYFFLGSDNKTLAGIINKMKNDYPNIRIADTYSPPFKSEFSEEETQIMVNKINHSKADILWVGMTAPKQEKWIYRNRNKLDTKFIGAIGAVFNFYAGNIKRSHPVFQRIGLEWLPRLIKEPRRLWRRNFISNPKFIFKVLSGKF